MGHRKSYYTKLFNFNIFLGYNFDLYLASLQCNALALKKGDHSKCVFLFCFLVIFLDKILKKESIVRTFIK